MPGDVGLVAILLSRIFGFFVDPDGFAKIKLENKLELIHAGIKLAMSNKDYATVDLLFEQYRELSVST